LAMHDAAPRRQPLHVAWPVSRRCPQGIGMIDKAMPHNGHCLESTMRMLRKSGYRLPVIHSPSIFAFKILANVPARQRSGRSQPFIAGRITIFVIHAEQKRIWRFPWSFKRFDDHSVSLSEHLQFAIADKKWGLTLLAQQDVHVGGVRPHFLSA